MVRTGRMHNYMRMYWGKKILECRTPRKPSKRPSFSRQVPTGGPRPHGCRLAGASPPRPPLVRRPVFGTIRYMTSTACPQVRAQAYVEAGSAPPRRRLFEPTQVCMNAPPSKTPIDDSALLRCGRLNEHGLQLKSYWTARKPWRFTPRISRALPVSSTRLDRVPRSIARATASAAAPLPRGRREPARNRRAFVTRSLHVDYLRPRPRGAAGIRGRNENQGRKISSPKRCRPAAALRPAAASRRAHARVHWPRRRLGRRPPRKEYAHSVMGYVHYQRAGPSAHHPHCGQPKGNPTSAGSAPEAIPFAPSMGPPFWAFCAVAGAVWLTAPDVYHPCQPLWLE
jgi:hypothetical protein